VIAMALASKCDNFRLCFLKNFANFTKIEYITKQTRCTIHTLIFVVTAAQKFSPEKQASAGR
jgi:hypothetical protein